MSRIVKKRSIKSGGSLSKEKVVKFRYYPSFCYRCLDKWLKKMSLQGLHIVHCGVFTFVFEEGKPELREYFTYGLSTQDGRYSVTLQYPFLEEKYGVKKAKSIINSNDSKKYQIVEIDITRIDIENDVGYKEMINDRDRLYMHYFLKVAIALSFVTAFLLTLLLFLI